MPLIRMGVFSPTHIRIPPGTPKAADQESKPKKPGVESFLNSISLRCYYVRLLTILKRLTPCQLSALVNIVKYNMKLLFIYILKLLSVETCGTPVKFQIRRLDTNPCNTVFFNLFDISEKITIMINN